MRSIKNQISIELPVWIQIRQKTMLTYRMVFLYDLSCLKIISSLKLFFSVEKAFSNWCKIYITSIISISKSVVHSWNHYWFLLMFSVHLKIIVERYVYWFLELIIVFLSGNYMYRGFYKNDEKLIYTIFRFDNSLNFASSLLTIDY